MNALTYVIASRNDNWGTWNHELTGTPVRRLVNAMQSVARYHPEAEVIVVDWGSRVPLFDAVRDYSAARRSGVRGRFIHVPAALTSRYPTPFCEVVALNIGIRRAHTDWIARLDQDIVIQPMFARWMRTNIQKTAYFSLRRDLAPGDIEPIGNEQTWHGWPLDADYHVGGAVGILLAPRDAWFHVRAYAEHLIHRCHMEHDLCFRFCHHCGIANLGLALNACFYHQWHPELPGREQNTYRNYSMKDAVPIPNTDNWGLAEAVFQEDVLGPQIAYCPTGFSIHSR